MLHFVYLHQLAQIIGNALFLKIKSYEVTKKGALKGLCYNFHVSEMNLKTCIHTPTKFILMFQYSKVTR